MVYTSTYILGEKQKTPKRKIGVSIWIRAPDDGEFDDGKGSHTMTVVTDKKPEEIEKAIREAIRNLE